MLKSYGDPQGQTPFWWFGFKLAEAYLAGYDSRRSIVKAVEALSTRFPFMQSIF